MNNENDDFKRHLKDDNFDDCPGYDIGYCKDGRCYDKSGSFIGSIPMSLFTIDWNSYRVFQTI